MFGTAGIWDHNHGIYPELTHVPLCISDGRESIDRHHETVSLVDVHRTVLDLAGCEPGGARGQNLYEDSTADDYLVERHGLRAARVEPVKEMKSDGELFERYDQSLRGVVLEDGSYAWETPDGLETRSDVDLDGAERRLDGLVCELGTAEVRLDDSRDVPTMSRPGSKTSATCEATCPVVRGAALARHSAYPSAFSRSSMADPAVASGSVPTNSTKGTSVSGRTWHMHGCS
jgi:hypothetical protein